MGSQVRPKFNQTSSIALAAVRRTAYAPAVAIWIRQADLTTPWLRFDVNSERSGDALHVVHIGIDQSIGLSVPLVLR